MKRIIFTTLFITVLAGSSWSQETMFIHKSNGTVQAVLLNEVDSIVFYAPDNTIMDIDGNVYHTLQLGDQTWLRENLMTTRYNNGVDVPLVTDNAEWEGLASAGFCWYNNDEAANKAMYGALYNWYVAETGNICPEGWHVPTDEEWTTLELFLISQGFNFDGSTEGNLLAKSMATASGWRENGNAGAVGNDDYPDKQNATGFSAVPAGARQAWGVFYAKNEGAGWWSSTENSALDAWARGLSYNGFLLGRSHDVKNQGHSIRCIKD